MSALLLIGLIAALAVVLVFSVFGPNAIVRVGARAVFALTFPVASVFAPWAIVAASSGPRRNWRLFSCLPCLAMTWVLAFLPVSFSPSSSASASASCSCSLSWTRARRWAVFVSFSFNWLSVSCGGRAGSR